MKKEIFRSIFFVAGLILLICMLVTGWFMLEATRRQVVSNLKTEANYIEQGIAAEGRGYLDYLEVVNRRITLIDKDGTVLADTDVNLNLLDNHMDREEIREAIQNGEALSIRYSDTLFRQMIYYAKNLSDGTVLRIAAATDSVFLLLHYVVIITIVIAIVIVILSYFFAKKISHNILKPINNLDIDNPVIETTTYKELVPMLKKIVEQADTIRNEHRRREEYRREFTSNISHELKTPLTAISGFAEIMKERGCSEAVVLDFSKAIYEQAQRLIFLVNDIIKLSELEGEAKHLEKSEVELYSIAKDITANLSPSAIKSQVSLNLYGTYATVQGNEKILREIIYNLCDNAIKYNRVHGNVSVIVGSVKGIPQITVKDTGIGISDEEQKRVFERFYRVDKSHSRLGGTGLGLSIVKHGVDFHKAKIILYSVLGHGTTITIEFIGTD